MPEGQKCSLKSVALLVDHQVTTGVAQSPLSNTGAAPDDHCAVWCSAIQVTWVRLKNKVTNGATWGPLSNTELLQKGVFYLIKKCKDVLTDMKVYFHAY